jgi:GTP cyclohydrolase II
MRHNQQKYDGIADYGLRIVERVPLISELHRENAAYLMAKQVLMGHTLGLAV